MSNNNIMTCCYVNGCTFRGSKSSILYTCLPFHRESTLKREFNHESWPHFGRVLSSREASRKSQVVPLCRKGQKKTIQVYPYTINGTELQESRSWWSMKCSLIRMKCSGIRNAFLRVHTVFILLNLPWGIAFYKVGVTSI